VELTFHQGRIGSLRLRRRGTNLECLLQREGSIWKDVSQGINITRETIIRIAEEIEGKSSEIDIERIVAALPKCTFHIELIDGEFLNRLPF
jgi:hypothetical protein